MTQTVLLTLGRLPKALDLARSFAAQGWRVVVAEPHRRHLAGASRDVARSVAVTAPAQDQAGYLRDLARVAAEEQAALVVPVSEEVLHVARLGPLLPPGCHLLAMPAEAVLRLHDKGGFAAAAASFGLNVPESFPLGDARAVALAAATDVVVKPLHGCSGRGIRRLPRGTALPPQEPALVQRLVRGQELSTCTLAHQGHVQGTAVYRGTLMSGSVAVGFERVVAPVVEAWVARFVAATGWSGFISFDFIVDAAGTPWGIECNPRTTSGLHFFHPPDIAAAILDPAQPLRFRRERRLQQFWSCLTETQHAFGQWRRFGASVRHLLTTRDVSWRWRDPLPLLTMPWTAWPIISAANRAGLPFGEVAMLDVGWAEQATAAGAAPSAAA